MVRQNVSCAGRRQASGWCKSNLLSPDLNSPDSVRTGRVWLVVLKCSHGALSFLLRVGGETAERSGPASSAPLAVAKHRAGAER